MAGAKIAFGSGITEVTGDAEGNIRIAMPNPVDTDGTDHTELVGSVRTFSETDNGEIVGYTSVLSAEVDDDYRMRIAPDTVLDHHRFNYSVQGTGKHTFVFTTLAATMTTAGLRTNSGSTGAINTGLNFGTHAQFPVVSNQTTICGTQLAFSAQPTSNVIIDFGLFQRGATTAFAPLDGMYFRLSSAGLQGVINSGGTETATGVFPLANGAGTWVYTDNTQYFFLIQSNSVHTTFWINNTKVGEIPTPSSFAMPCKSEALPWSIRHAIVGGAAGDNTLQALVTGYYVGLRGAMYTNSVAEVASRVQGSYQGYGAVIGQLVAGTVTSGTLVKPTAAVPLNASLAANLPNSLGGRIYETLTAGLAANVDGIYASYQVPAGSSTVAGRRLVIIGIKLSGFVSTVVAGGTANQIEWYIAFGHTAVSMATTESASMATATTKAPRRVMLPELTTTMTLTQAANTPLSMFQNTATFISPIYVNPGEFVALVGNKTGTVPTSGVLSYTYQFDYSWE